MKNKSYEKYLLVILGIICAVLGILVLTNHINPKYFNKEVIDFDRRLMIGIIFILCGVLVIFLSVKEFIKENKIKKYSVFNLFFSLIESNELNSHLNNHFEEGLVKFEIDEIEEGIKLIYNYDNGAFICLITKLNVYFDYSYNEEYLNSLSNDEQEKLPLYAVDNQISALHIDVNELLNKFKNFINENISNINKE